jgi:branched-chain amino acid transport system ATP-binding protein
VNSVTDSTTLLHVKELRKSFGGQVILNGVDVDLREGEVVLLSGENGSGKTTLLNILTGNLEPDSGVVRYGLDGSNRTYRFPRRWWQEMNPWDHYRPEFVSREGIGRTWQDIRLFSKLTLQDNIDIAIPSQPGENPLRALFSLGQNSTFSPHNNSDALTMLDRLGLTGREKSSADMVSLGQSKRVAIARAVVAGARVLFLDEPLAGLDRQGIKDVLSLLESLVRERNFTLVIVEHIFNQHHLHGFVTTEWFLKSGKIEVCKSRDSKANRYTSLGNGAASQHGGRPEWVSLLTGDDTEVTDELLPRGALLTRARRRGYSQQTAKPVLEISQLTVKRGHRIVIGLDDQGDEVGFNLTLFEGEAAVLQAPNGWGKSTLYAAIAGLLPIAQGKIHLRGRDLTGLPVWERFRLGLSVLPSTLHTFPRLTVKESLRLAGDTNMTEALSNFADRPISSLSGGQKQRVALASMRSGDLNIYDEPLTGLDRPDPFIERCLLDASSGGTSFVLMPSTVS